jgi:hypothetical protein
MSGVRGVRSLKQQMPKVGRTLKKKTQAVAALQKKIETKDGAPVPCREWCYKSELGVPVPPNPPKYPEAGCMAHKRGLPCMYGRDKQPKWFAHPDEAEWQRIPGVTETKKAVELAKKEWDGSFASVVPAAAAAKSNADKVVLSAPKASLPKQGDVVYGSLAVIKAPRRLPPLNNPPHLRNTYKAPMNLGGGRRATKKRRHH